MLGLTKERINNDECDAYWISILTKRFWELFLGEIKEVDLTEKEKNIFIALPVPNGRKVAWVEHEIFDSMDNVGGTIHEVIEEQGGTANV